MNFNDIFNEIKKSFGGLWQSKQRGNSFEIITPYATTNNKFISVFLTKQGNDYVITDGGWINGGIYDILPNHDETTFIKILYHFQCSFDIKEIESEGIIYYYTKANNLIDIPSRVLSFSTFVQNIISISELDFETKTEKETKKRFFSKANEYLKTFDSSDKLKIGGYLIPDKKQLKFNALYNNASNNIVLVNYITGSTETTFANSIYRTNILFEMAESTVYKNNIVNKVSLIDTSAGGYLPTKISHFLLHLENKTGSKIIPWVERERLKLEVFNLN